VTGMLTVTQGDRARWQRQAAAELCRILEAHWQLPAIAWTAGPAGCVLAGRVNGLAPAAQVRAAFTAWRQALELDDVLETLPGSGAVAYLRARAWRGGVRVTVTAAVFTEDGHDDGGLPGAAAGS
jgi:hypothetical protein